MENSRNIKNMIEYPKEGILSKELFKTSKVDMTLFCMSRGSEMSKHTSTKEGLIIVLEGNGMFNLQGERIAMRPGISIRMKKNAVHSLKAKENTSFVLILFA
ncbi:MAG: cupin domain-containing protein [Candidatus Aenigmatarchaeota archaeon]